MKGVVKFRNGSSGCESHIKHLLEMSQTKLYEIFKNENKKLNLGKDLLGNINDSILEHAETVTHPLIETT